MNRLVGIALACSVILMSCDKVENPVPAAEPTDLDYDLYPDGDANHYLNNAWPTFGPNTNTLRNVMIEDFTGHQCNYCPLAADIADAIHNNHPTRTFIATIHTGPPGTIQGTQGTSIDYPIDWTNPDGLAIGYHFGDGWVGTQFTANPAGTVNRIKKAGLYPTLAPADWEIFTENALLTPLLANIQAASNYYPSTRGVFLHTEIEVDASVTNQLYTVVYLIEDSLIALQKMPNNLPNENYVHRDIMRDCVSSGWKGKEIVPADIENGKYLFNYSFALPTEYNAENMHLLIYVRDQVTEEIYHVIRQDIE